METVTVAEAIAAGESGKRVAGVSATTALRILRALQDAERPEWTAREIAEAHRMGNSTVTKGLAALEKANLVTRIPGELTGKGPVRAPATWRLVASPEPAMNGRDTTGYLKRGELRAQVAEFLSANPGEWSPYKIYKAIGARSAPAVLAACRRLVAQETVEQACDKPRRFRALT